MLFFRNTRVTNTDSIANKQSKVDKKIGKKYGMKTNKN